MKPAGILLAPSAAEVLLQKTIAVGSDEAINSPGVLRMKTQRDCSVTLRVFPLTGVAVGRAAAEAEATIADNPTKVKNFMIADNKSKTSLLQKFGRNCPRTYTRCRALDQMKQRPLERLVLLNGGAGVTKDDDFPLNGVHSVSLFLTATIVDFLSLQ